MTCPRPGDSTRRTATPATVGCSVAGLDRGSDRGHPRAAYPTTSAARVPGSALAAKLADTNSPPEDFLAILGHDVPRTGHLREPVEPSYDGPPSTRTNGTPRSDRHLTAAKTADHSVMSSSAENVFTCSSYRKENVGMYRLPWPGPCQLVPRDLRAAPRLLSLGCGPGKPLCYRISDIRGCWTYRIVWQVLK